MADPAELSETKPEPTPPIRENGTGLIFKVRLLWTVIILSGAGSVGFLFQKVLHDSEERDKIALEESVRARNEVIMFRQEMKDEISRVRVEFGAQHQLIFDRLGKLDARMDTLARNR